MLSKQHLANPGLRYQQARRDPGEAQAPNVAAANPNVASNPNAASVRNSQDLWVNNVNNPNAAGVALRPASLGSSGVAARPPSRLDSRTSVDSFYNDDDTAPPQPGAMRMPGLDGQLDDDSDHLNIKLPAAVDPYHSVVAQAVDESAESELLKRVLNLEQDLKNSYQTMLASTTHSRVGGISTAEGSDPETDALRQRVQELESQLATGTTHSRELSSDSAEFATAGPNETIPTAPSSRIVVATVDTSVRISERPAAVVSGRAEDVELGNGSEEEEESKGIPRHCKCLFCLILLGGIGAAVYFLVPFGGDDADVNPVQVTPTEAPIPAPTLAPTAAVICPPLNDLFQGNSTYAPSGSKNHTFSIDCNIIGDVSAIQIDRFTCEPSCAFLLERSAYETLCVDNTFEFNVPDSYFGVNKFELGHLNVDGNFTCVDATKYVIPDPSVSPTVAPTAVASANPTLVDMVPTEPPTVRATPAPTPPAPTPLPTNPPTAPPTLPPTPPPTEPAVDRLGQALNLYFPGESISETSAEYRALEWAALNDSRNVAVDSAEFRERFTLANLYYATNGESWTRRSGWTSGDDHCNWEGVSCSNRQVSELDLRDNNMSGPMIRTWGNLALISRLRMSGNSLSGSLPKEIGEMSNLGRLELSENALDGELPTEVGKLVQLTNLQIRNNSFRGQIPTQLGSLNRLQSWVAEFNQFTGQIPDELAGMTSLRNIYLGRNQLRGPIPASFGDLGQLTLISISENRLSGAFPPELGRMTNLQRFSVAQNQFTGSIPEEFGAWTAMTYLSVFDNQLTGTLPSSLTQWKNTDTIYFYETAVTGSMNSFCGSSNVGASNFEFYAECGLECSCCTHCCTNQNCQSL